MTIESSWFDKALSEVKMEHGMAMDGSIYYLHGVRPCVLLYKWRNTFFHDVFRIRLIHTHELMDVSPRDLHLNQRRDYA